MASTKRPVVAAPLLQWRTSLRVSRRARPVPPAPLSAIRMGAVDGPADRLIDARANAGRAERYEGIMATWEATAPPESPLVSAVAPKSAQGAHPSLQARPVGPLASWQ